MQEDEVWKLIPGHPNYLCSNMGRVKSKAKYHKWTLLTFKSVGSHGYHPLSLGRKSRHTLHSIIALVFLGEPEGKHINHKNGIKTDNRVSNLEYVTQKENNIHALRTGLINNKGGNHGRATVSDIQACVIREAVKIGYSQSSVGRYFKIPRQTVNGIIKGRAFKYLPL